MRAAASADIMFRALCAPWGRVFNEYPSLVGYPRIELELVVYKTTLLTIEVVPITLGRNNQEYFLY